MTSEIKLYKNLHSSEIALDEQHVKICGIVAIDLILI